MPIVYKTISTFWFKCFVFILTLNIVCVSFIPHHMDEYFAFYHLISRPENLYFDINTFQLKLFFIAIPFPYAYVGPWQAVLFYPFYLVFDIITSKMIFGSMGAVTALILIKKIAKLDITKNIFFVFSLPLCFTYLYDGGPIWLQTLIYLSSPILFKTALNHINRPKRIIYLLILSVWWLIGLTDKIFFLFLYPSLIVWTSLLCPKEQISANKSEIIGFILFSTFLITLTIFLPFEGPTQDLKLFSAPYISFSGNSNRLFVLIRNLIERKAIDAQNLKLYLEEVYTSIKIFIQQFDFSFYLLRNLNFKNFIQYTFLGDLKLLGVIGCILLLIQTYITFKSNSKRLKLIAIAYYQMALIFITVGNVRFNHHMVYLIPVLWIWILNVQTIPWLKNCWAIFLLINAMLFLTNITLAKPNFYLKDSYYTVKNAINRKDGKYLINFDSWNYFYIAWLDLPKNQLITQIPESNIDSHRKLKEKAKQKGLKILQISAKKAEDGKILPLPSIAKKNIVYQSENLVIHYLDQ